MKNRFKCLLFLFVSLSCQTVCGQVPNNASQWTEERLGKIIMLAEKFARKKQWSSAIKYGEEVMNGVQALNQITDARYIHQLKNLNQFYDKANRLREVAPRVLQAYELSRKHLGLSHETTSISRQLLYKLYISKEKYADAIPLVQESISLLSNSRQDQYRLFNYLEQLYSLYGVLGKLEQEEQTLLRLLMLNTHLFGNNVNENLNIIKNLARNYCLQKKAPEFNLLMAIYHLNYDC